MANNKKTTDASSKKTTVRADEIITSKENQIKSVVSNISMLYNTIRELKERENYSKIESLNAAQEENFAKLANVDAEIAEKMIKKYRTNNKGMLVSRLKEKQEDTTECTIVRNPIDQTEALLELFNKTQEEDEEEYGLYKDDVEVSNVKVDEFEHFDNTDEIYDVLDLPSKGQCYPNKKSKIAVSYLTATDENFITSPSLYRDGLIIDCLLSRKIVDKSIDIDSLCSGDVDAITFFLRVSSYGADFPATFTDPDTNEAFETTIDLNQIKVKPFNLQGDENGYFDFTLPVSKDVIKFRFLTKKDERKLEKLNQLGTNKQKSIELDAIKKYLEALIESDGSNMEEDTRYQLEDGIKALDELTTEYSEKEGLPINKIITNRLEMMVMSVNGNQDKTFIKKYVRNMIAKDSITLRRYILENTPGMDFSVKIEKPESLGGGFIDTFLDWSDTVFLSVS